jgi:hypothetical protein
MFVCKYLNIRITSPHRTPRFSSPIPRQANQFAYLSRLCTLPGTVYVDAVEVLDSPPYATAFIQPEFHLSPQLLPQQEP